MFGLICKLIALIRLLLSPMIGAMSDSQSLPIAPAKVIARINLASMIGKRSHRQIIVGPIFVDPQRHKILAQIKVGDTWQMDWVGTRNIQPLWKQNLYSQISGSVMAVDFRKQWVYQAENFSASGPGLYLTVYYFTGNKILDAQPQNGHIDDIAIGKIPGESYRLMRHGGDIDKDVPWIDVYTDLSFTRTIRFRSEGYPVRMKLSSASNQLYIIYYGAPTSNFQ